LSSPSTSASLTRRATFSSTRCAVPCQRKSRHTTHHQDLPEKVTIVRARHPFEGQSLNLLATLHRKGRRLLLLILPDGSKSLIPADWTNLASPAPPLSAASPATTLASFEDLLHARTVIDALLDRLAPGSREDGNSLVTKESPVARKKSKPLRSSARRNRSLGNPARGTPSPRDPNPGAAHRPDSSTKSGEGEAS